MIGFNSMNGGEPAARYRWTGRVWDIIGWTSRLYESHPIITIVENYMKKNHIRFFSQCGSFDQPALQVAKQL